MAADGHLKAAVTELTSAIVDLDQQVRQLQHDHDTQRRQLEEEIKHIEHLMAAETVEVSHGHNDMVKSLTIDHMRHQHGDIDQKKTEISRLQNDTNQAVQRKNQLSQTLKSLASQLEMLASSPDIR